MGPDASASEERPAEAPEAGGKGRTPAARAGASLGLFVLAIVLVLAAVSLASPGPPQVFMYVFPGTPSGCNATTDHYDFPLDVELFNDGGPAWITLQATMDGAPARINGVSDTISVYAYGSSHPGYASFFVPAPDCSAIHAADAAIVAVVPA